MSEIVTTVSLFRNMGTEEKVVEKAMVVLARGIRVTKK
jgi:hypothetical protein